MIKKAEEKDIDTIANLAILMFSNHSIEDLINKFSENFFQRKMSIFLEI